MVHEFTIPVGLEEKVVSITVDEESGRAAIRVDGKMAGRPLAPDEEQREIRVGPDRYLVRREWNEFDVEYIGPAENTMSTPAVSNKTQERPMPRLSGGFPVGKVLLAIVIMVVGGAIYKPVAEAVVDWDRFMAPDNTFWVEMPGEVVEAKLGSFAKTAGAKAWIAERNGKIFEVGYVDIPGDVRPGWEHAFINGVRDGIAKKYKGNVVHDKDWPGGTELMMHCEAWRNSKDEPPGPRDVRMRIMIRDHRVVIAAASAPPRQMMSIAVTRFFLSVKA